jgi:hypothetical protein
MNNPKSSPLQPVIVRFTRAQLRQIKLMASSVRASEEEFIIQAVCGEVEGWGSFEEMAPAALSMIAHYVDTRHTPRPSF